MFCWNTGHDYYTYVDAWDYIITNQFIDNTSGNAYGPLFYLFTYLYKVHYDLPRFLFLIIYLLGVYISTLQLSPIHSKKQAIWWMLMVWNPLIFLFGMKYGNNDVLMSGFLLLSLLGMAKKKSLLSGLFIGLAISV